MANSLGLGLNQADLQVKVQLNTAIDQCRSARFDPMILNQIIPNGLGSDLAKESDLDANREVRLQNLLEYLKAQTYGFRIINFLANHFDKVEILEQCGEFFKLRVPKEDKTIGWVFG